MVDTRRGVVAGVVAVVVALMATFMSPQVAEAALIAPDHLATVAPPAPPGATASVMPILTWSPVPGAASYRVQVARAFAFDSIMVDDVTIQTRYTLNLSMPPGDVFWRVFARDAAGNVSPASATGHVVVEGLGAPSPLSPADGAALTHLVDPVTLEWSSVPGATSYEVVVGTTPDFSSRSVDEAVAGTRLTLPDPQEPGHEYYWRVAARSAIHGDAPFSVVRTFRTVWTQQPVLVAPAEGSTVRDVGFVWQPVAGAASYRIEVAPTADFVELSISSNVNGTHFQPPFLRPGSLFWRVRAFDPVGHAGPWSDTGRFIREAPQKPTLLSPEDGQHTAGPLTLRWTAVVHATRYDVQISADPMFQGDVTWQMSAAGTTLVFPATADFELSYGVMLHWRVRAVDPSNGLTGVWSDPRAVLPHVGAWDPAAPDGPAYVERDRVTVLSPVDGAAVAQPVFRWTRDQVGVEAYRLRVQDKDGALVVDVETLTSHVTPNDVLDPAGSPYRWSVLPATSGDAPSRLPSEDEWHSFDLTPPVETDTLALLTPAPAASAVEMPDFTWEPYPGATQYLVKTSIPGSGATDVLGVVHAPGLTPTGTPYAPGTYEWFVEAYEGGTLLQTSATRTFTVERLTDAMVTNQVTCPQCAEHDVVGSTPVLQWDPVAGATTYQVYLSLDPEFRTAALPTTTTVNRYSPMWGLAANTAEHPVWYWHVRPCYTDANCADDPVGHAAPAAQFTLRSIEFSADQLTPAEGAHVQIPAPDGAVTPTFTWPDIVDLGGAVDADRYEVQVATTAEFDSSIVDDQWVPQNFYTPSSGSYPWDQVLYWRVRAMAGTGDRFPWSATRTFTRPGHAPVQVAPAADAIVVGAPSFEWEPVEGARGYQFELYRRGDLDTNADGAPVVLPQNLLVQAVASTTTYTPVGALAPGVYSWRVAMLDAVGARGPWTPAPPVARRVTIARTPPTLVSPPDGALLNDKGLLFTWDAPPLAQHYTIEIATTSTFNIIVGTYSTRTNAVALPVGVEPSVNPYYWRVTAYGGPLDQFLATSGTRSFMQTPYAPGGCGDTPFSDVVPTTTFCREIAWLYDAGITTGSVRSDGNLVFLPGNEVSRLAMASFLWRTAGRPAVSHEQIFADVAPNDPSIPADKYAAIQWMGVEGLSTGTPNPPGKPRFAPNASVSRQAMAAFLYRFGGHPTVAPASARFADVPPSAPFFAEIQWMGQSGLSTGSPNPPGLPVYKPNDPVSRQAMAAFLYRFHQL